MTDNSTGSLPCARCKQLFPGKALHQMWQAPFFVVKLFCHILPDHRLFCPACAFRLNALVITALLVVFALVTSPWWIRYLDEVFKRIT